MASYIIPADELTMEVAAAFEKKFGVKPCVAARAPGRVNLIGEHTDYNDGFVFPMALPMVTVIVGNPTASELCRVETLSPNVKDTYTEFSLNELKPGDPKWCNYLKGVAAHMPGKISSFDALIGSSVPLGGGVSSSAAMEVATYTFLEQMMVGSDIELTDTEKILICQRAEHEFADMPCGIMDQFISMQGKEGHALLIDCRDKRGKQIPMNDPSVVVLVINSNVKHELTGSEYPTRRKQCELAAKILGVPSLRDATDMELQAHRHQLDDETYRRVRHVVSEIKRTTDAAAALENDDYNTFGNLMVASHNSLRDDYEVSCKELDQLVEFALEMRSEGVYGSRMTGGGFGGCTVSLVKSCSVDKVIEHIDRRYKETGNQATFYICQPSDGACKVNFNEVAVRLAKKLADAAKTSEKQELGDSANGSHKQEVGDADTSDKKEVADTANGSHKQEVGDADTSDKQEVADTANGSHKQEVGDGATNDKQEVGDGATNDKQEVGDGATSDKQEVGDTATSDKQEVADTANGSHKQEVGDTATSDKKEVGDTATSDKKEVGDTATSDKKEVADTGSGSHKQDEKNPDN